MRPRSLNIMEVINKKTSKQFEQMVVSVYSDGRIRLNTKMVKVMGLEKTGTISMVKLDPVADRANIFLENVTEAVLWGIAKSNDNDAFVLRKLVKHNDALVFNSKPLANQLIADYDESFPEDGKCVTIRVDQKQLHLANGSLIYVLRKKILEPKLEE